MTRRLPPLNALRAFEVAARHLSFTDAAKEMCITPAAISQQVKRLEDELCVSLFHRLPRGLVLTDEGMRYASRLTALFGEIDAATQELHVARRVDTLTLVTMPSLAARWLIPRLTSFDAANPDIRVRVLAETSLDDLDHSGADLVIRYGDGRFPNVVGMLPFPRTVFPVCSPAIVAGDKAIRVPADLARHVLLQLDDDRFPAGYDDWSWKRWLPLVGTRRIVDRLGPSFTFVHLMLQAAAAGQGVAIASLALTADDIVSGRLIRPLPDEVQIENGYWLLRPSSSPETRKSLLFREWLMAEVRNFVIAATPIPPGRS